MTERDVSCPRCRQENPPRNRFCGSCGSPLTSGEQLATREEHRPVPPRHAWPSKLRPAGKALAAGVAALAAEAGLSWLQRRIGTEERSSLPAVRDADSASRHYLAGHSLEEIFLQAWEDSHGLAVARREVRSFVSIGPTGRRRQNTFSLPLDRSITPIKLLIMAVNCLDKPRKLTRTPPVTRLTPPITPSEQHISNSNPPADADDPLHPGQE